MYLTKHPRSPHCFKIIRNTIVVKSVVISAIGITGIVIFPAKEMGTRNYHALKQVSDIMHQFCHYHNQYMHYHGTLLFGIQ